MGRAAGAPIDAREAVALETEESVVGADPELSAMVFEDAEYETVGQAFLAGEAAEAAAAVTDHAAAFGADPEIAIL